MIENTFEYIRKFALNMFTGSFTMEDDQINYDNCSKYELLVYLVFNKISMKC